MIEHFLSGNYTKYLAYLPLFIGSFLISLLATPIIGIIAKKLNIIDLPGTQRKDPTAQRRIHETPKLKLGGAAVIFPFIFIILIYIPISKELISFIIGISILLITGIVDDIFDISAIFQIIMQAIATLIVIFSGININILSNPLGGILNLNILNIPIMGNRISIIPIIITFIWILFVINAVKWMAGSDGLAEGNISIAAVIIALLSIRFETHYTAIMGFAFAGLMLGLLFYNFYPSKIFSGSTGKSVYGFIIAVLAIYSGAKLASTILVLAIPIIDAIWVIITRIKEEKPKGIVSLMKINDKRHLHHRLISLGYSQKTIALVEYSITSVLGILALLITGFHKALILAIFIFLIFLTVIFITKKSKS